MILFLGTIMSCPKLKVSEVLEEPIYILCNSVPPDSPVISLPAWNVPSASFPLPKFKFAGVIVFPPIGVPVVFPNTFIISDSAVPPSLISISSKQISAASVFFI